MAIFHKFAFPKSQWRLKKICFSHDKKGIKSWFLGTGNFIFITPSPATSDFVIQEIKKCYVINHEGEEQKFSLQRCPEKCVL
jgi:hypothetical protein